MCFVINTVIYTFFQAKRSLERAMKLDPSYMEAVYLMANILLQQAQYEEGITLWVFRLQPNFDCCLAVIMQHACLSVRHF